MCSRQLQMKISRARLGAFEGARAGQSGFGARLDARVGVPSNRKWGGDAPVVVLLATVSKQEI